MPSKKEETPESGPCPTDEELISYDSILNAETDADFEAEETNAKEVSSE